MSYWQSGIVLNGLLILGLLLVASMFTRAGPLKRVGLPVSIIGGVIGLLLGPDIAGLLPFDRSVLESIVYHGLGLVFIAVALQSPPDGERGSGVTSIAFAVPLMGAVQAAIGLLVVLLLVGAALHPGFGVLLPYGYEQGPGQALSIGAAWEEVGLENGSQVGLILATFGFGWAIVFGVPLVIWGRSRGLFLRPGDRRAREGDQKRREELPPGTLEVLTSQVVSIGVIYLITYGLMLGLSRLLAGMPGIASMIWGFHYVLGMLVALAIRPVVSRVVEPSPFDDEMLGRLAGLAVDVVTCSALAAVQIAVLQANWLPIVLVTSLGGFATLLIAVWLARRAFAQEPFEHAVVLFGMATGTLPMGLALLRIVDPEMRGRAPSSCVMGSAAAIPLAAPLYLAILPWPVLAWPDGHPGTTWATLGVLVVFIAGLLALWRWLGPLRFLGPLWSPWPDLPDRPAGGIREGS